MEQADPVLVADQSLIASLIPPRNPASHKGNHGHALLIAGNTGKMGAAVLSSTACLRSGAGLLTVNVPREERSILQTSIPEAMLMMREEGGTLTPFSAIGIGPGMGVDDAGVALLENLLENYQKPVLIDADALTVLSLNRHMWAMIPVNSVLTPHPGEFDRMFGKHDSIAERNVKAIQLSLLHPWVIVLKGQQTQIAYEGKAYINTTGNAGLAKGGSGDTLTGIILSFLAQGYTALNAAITGVYLHGLAADLALQDQSMESMLATDIPAYLGKAFKTIAGA
ncbi:MAG: NAD(P)H-hydrate dehydratase [Rhizobacter sp.]|nr:NAD(P)H-hydrate dehydratase [Ferruginibacter sp.]